jgi:hypothetical protein
MRRLTSSSGGPLFAALFLAYPVDTYIHQG